jgi:hypothetical protein
MQALTNNQNAHAAALAAFKPTFDKIQQMMANGQEQILVNNLPIQTMRECPCSRPCRGRAKRNEPFAKDR